MNSRQKLVSVFISTIVVVAFLFAGVGALFFPYTVTQTVTETFYEQHTESTNVLASFTECFGNGSIRYTHYVVFAIADAQTKIAIPDITINQLHGPYTSMIPEGNWKTNSNGIALTNVGVSYNQSYPYEFTYINKTVRLDIRIIQPAICVRGDWYFPIYIELSTTNVWHQLTEAK